MIWMTITSWGGRGKTSKSIDCWYWVQLICSCKTQNPLFMETFEAFLCTPPHTRINVQEYPLLLLGIICLIVPSGCVSLAPYLFGRVINYAMPNQTNW